MTVYEFKKLKPEYKDLEGSDLWNEMENYMLRQQAGQEVMKTAVPFFKRYQLRYLFYRRLPNYVFPTKYTAQYRCKICKQPVIMIWGYMGKSYCPNNHELIQEPNTNWDRRFYLLKKFFTDMLWKLLEKIHLLRSTHDHRYDLFGDESKYVKHWIADLETGKTDYILKKRKWWEYIFIERKQFNF